MISKAMTFLSGFLNNEIRLQHGINNDPVIAGSLINLDGSVTENIENKIVASIINLEHETTVKSPGNYLSNDNNQYGKTAPPVYLNLYLLISANYNSSNYLEALKMLSTVISVFQSNSYFTKQKNPNMPSPLNRLTLEIFNLPINELSHIWSGIGAKYVPSILYKVRMIAIQDETIKEIIPGIAGLKGTSKTKNDSE